MKFIVRRTGHNVGYEQITSDVEKVAFLLHGEKEIREQGIITLTSLESLIEFVGKVDLPVFIGKRECWDCPGIDYVLELYDDYMD